jgi:ABC-type uncharacterized transport system
MSFVESFRAARWIRTLNLILQALLFLSFFLGLNYLALHYQLRFDLTTLHKYSLSPETKSYLEQLTQPVTIVVTLTDDADKPEFAQAYREVNQLLREYVFSTETNAAGRIKVDYLDIYQRRRDAEQYGIEAPNTIVVICGEKRRVIALNELHQVEHGKNVAFTGEQAFTAAILDVTSPERKKIYFLSGHGEMDLMNADPAAGLSMLRDELSARNFLLDRLQLSVTRKVPDDAALIVSAGPTGPYTPFEEELLRQYLSNRAGRLILLASPGPELGLSNLLSDWGIRSENVVIYDQAQKGQAETGDLVFNSYAPHPITNPLLNYNHLPVTFGWSRCVRKNPETASEAGLIVTRLIAPAETAWGEYDWRSGHPHYNEGVDIPGKALGVAVASERVTPEAKLNLPFSIRRGRMVAFGCADFIANNRISVPGNITLIISTINWAVNRDAQLNVPARPIEKYQLALSERDHLRLRYSLLFGLPAIAGLLGLIVYWTRRS